jgi:hypothetical protein
LGGGLRSALLPPEGQFQELMEMHRTSKRTKNVSTAAKRDHRIREFIVAQLAYVLADEGSGQEREALTFRDAALATLTRNERLHAVAIAIGLKNVLSRIRNGMPEGEFAGVAVASAEGFANAASAAMGLVARDAP